MTWNSVLAIILRLITLQNSVAFGVNYVKVVARQKILRLHDVVKTSCTGPVDVLRRRRHDVEP